MKMADCKKGLSKKQRKGRSGEKKGVQNHIEKEADADTKMGIQSD